VASYKAVVCGYSLERVGSDVEFKGVLVSTFEFRNCTMPLQTELNI